MTPMTPRQQGMLAAQDLRRSVQHNPFKEPGLVSEHHIEWQRGFCDTRAILHRHLRSTIGAGIGLLTLWRFGRDRTREALIKAGKAEAETLCLMILAAMLEVESTTYDIQDPQMVLTVYAGMKQRMTNLPAQCEIPDLAELHGRCHNVAGALLVLFTAPTGGITTLNVDRLDAMLDKMLEMEVETRNQMARGEFTYQE
jgi:hypothetical protein